VQNEESVTGAHLHLTNYDLCSAMKESCFAFTDFKQQQRVLQEFILSKLNLEGKACEDSDALRELNQKLKSFLAHAVEKYRKDCCKFDQFLIQKKNSEFLKNNFPLPKSLIQLTQQSSNEESLVKSSAPKRLKVGRKSLPFNEKSVRAQQYASAKIREEHEAGAILLAASQQPTNLGQLVRRSNSSTGRTAAKALKAISLPEIPGKEATIYLKM
jgi:hypothetical protein